MTMYVGSNSEKAIALARRYTWPEAEKEFLRIVMNSLEKKDDDGQIKDYASCRQTFVRSYTFTKEARPTAAQKTKAWFLQKHNVMIKSAKQLLSCVTNPPYNRDKKF